MYHFSINPDNCLNKIKSKRSMLKQDYKTIKSTVHMHTFTNAAVHSTE